MGKPVCRLGEYFQELRLAHRSWAGDGWLVLRLGDADYDTPGEDACTQVTPEEGAEGQAEPMEREGLWCIGRSSGLYLGCRGRKLREEIMRW